jgi:hypothetical protein
MAMAGFCVFMFASHMLVSPFRSRAVNRLQAALLFLLLLISFLNISLVFFAFGSSDSDSDSDSGSAGKAPGFEYQDDGGQIIALVESTLVLLPFPMLLGLMVPLGWRRMLTFAL